MLAAAAAAVLQHPLAAVAASEQDPFENERQAPPSADTTITDRVYFDIGEGSAVLALGDHMRHTVRMWAHASQAKLRLRYASSADMQLVLDSADCLVC